MRVVCISDTHSRHRTISGIPHGDVLVHAGDCTGNGSLSALEDFTKWLASWPHEYKILIAGNHDYCFERYPQESRDLCNKCGITYLEDEQVSIREHTFFGSPWTPVFRKMAFNADEAEISKLRARIPESVTVLVTHGPAWRIFDYVPREAAHVGCCVNR
jgi:predicted phosphohydrolase